MVYRIARENMICIIRRGYHWKKGGILFLFIIKTKIDMNRRKQGDVSWYLPNKRRPFAYSTIAEADTIAILLEEFRDLRAVVSANRILSQQEKIIIQTFIDNGIYKPIVR